MTFTDFLLHILIGLIHSTIFIYVLLFWLRPNIKISPIIAKTKDIEGSESIFYIFKVVNLSWFSAFDIETNLYSVKLYPTKNGTNHRLTPIDMSRRTLTSVKCYRPKYISKGYGDYACYSGQPKILIQY